MKRTQVIALLLVVIMAVATVPAIAAAEQHQTPAQTPTVGATPTLTIGHTPTYPTRGQTYTVSGRLSWAGLGLANRPLILWVMWPQNGPWQWHSTTITSRTNANGYYSFSTSSLTQEVWWKVRFAGDAVYYPKNAYNQVFIGYTTTSIASTNYYPAHYVTYTIYGYVKNGYGQPLANARVLISGTSVTRAGGVTITIKYTISVTTNANGYYHADEKNRRGYAFNLPYTAVFQGYPYSASSYWSSSSRTIIVHAAA